MKTFIKKFLPLVALPLLLTGCDNTKLGKVNSHNIDGNSNQFGYEGNFIQPELTVDGKDDEPEWQGSNVSQELTFTCAKNEVKVKMFRGEESLFVFFSVKDRFINSVGNNNGDDVSISDSVEFYIDSKNDGGTRPQTDDYQINLGVNGRTRMLVGTGTNWNSWNGLCQYEVQINGTLNDNSDFDTGYTVEAMLPWKQINCTKDSAFGIAFGCVDKKTDDATVATDWGGVIFDGMLVEPQTPNNYFTYSGNNFIARPYVATKINLAVNVVDEENTPIRDAQIKVSGFEEPFTSDILGGSKIGKVDPTNDVELEISKDGFKTKKYTLKHADLVYKGGDYTYKAVLKEGTGDDVVSLNYVEAGQTLEKFVFIKQFATAHLFVAKDDPLGINLKIVSDVDFDENQLYEVYLDTGLKARTITDTNTWCFKFINKLFSGVSRNPKGASYKFSSEYANATFTDKVAELYIPYALLEITANTEFGVTMGIWDNDVEDWSPMARNSIEARVEYPNQYIRIDQNCEIIDTNVVADSYNFVADTRSYANLGTFSGKSFGEDSFSKVTIEVDHSNTEYFAVRFTTDQEVWNNFERIEFYMDVGDSARQVRDGDTYQMIISTAQGVITSFMSYGGGDAISIEELHVYMDETHMLLTIPYSVIGITSVDPVGVTFGMFNLIADDFDGYAYNNVYIDPAKPNLYLRVHSDNTIE